MVKTKNKKIYFFLGTVAEFGKLTPIFKELQSRNIPYKIIDSGQNEVNYNDFEPYLGKVKPDIKLSQKMNKSSLLVFIFWALGTLIKGFLRLSNEFKGLNRSNSFLVIHGDTVTSTIGAVLGNLFGLKVVHIESGYFSYNFLEPFPEEICKNINVRLAQVLFPPTEWATNNLDGFKKEIINTGHNTNIESFWWAFNKKKRSSKVLKFKKFYILIVHRQEHVLFRKDWSRQIMEYVILNSDPELTCVLLNHPLTVQIIDSLKLGDRRKKVKIISHFSYPDFVNLLDRAEYIATDSATIQQEAFYMGKPFLGLADYSVQTEGLGKNAVICKSNKKVIKHFLNNYRKFKMPPIKPNIRPSKIVVDYLSQS